MNIDVPIATITRLTALYQVLLNLLSDGIERVSSKELERITGFSAFTIRKDIQHLVRIGQTGSGYDIRNMLDTIGGMFGLNRQIRACLAGLGNLGLSLLQYEQFNNSGYTIVAGFDTNINKLETLQSDIRLYPAYEIVDIIKRFEIELGIIAVPSSSAQEVADNMINAGIHSIINFAPLILKKRDEKVIIRNIDIMQQFRIVSAIRTLNK